MAVKLSNEKMAELREAFMLFDYSKTGRISARDIGPVIRSVGLKPSEAEVQSIMADVQQMGGEVDLSTLVQLIHQKVTNPPAEQPKDLAEIFRLYDKDGRGLVSVAEMRHLLTSVGEKLTDDEADQLLKMSGCVQGGMVQYDKFVQIILRG
jgi:calmodulin